MGSRWAGLLQAIADSRIVLRVQVDAIAVVGSHAGVAFPIASRQLRDLSSIRLEDVAIGIGDRGCDALANVGLNVERVLRAQVGVIVICPYDGVIRGTDKPDDQTKLIVFDPDAACR